MMKRFLCIWCVFLLFSSCSNDTDLPKNKVEIAKTDYKVINGTLYFNSIESFSKLIDSLCHLGSEELYAWEKENDFYSLLHAIDDAEEQIFVGDSISQEQLDKYSDIVYFNEYEMLEPYILARIYQIACNRNGEFYIDKTRYEVSRTHITMGSLTKSGEYESIPYISTDGVMTKGDVEGKITLGAAGYQTDSRMVNAYMYLYRTVFNNQQGQKVGQLIFELKSEAGKKRLGRWKSYKTQHLIEGSAHHLNNVCKVIKDSKGNVVRYEMGSDIYTDGASLGTVGGDEKNCVISLKMQGDDYVPINYIPIDKANVVYAEMRARTRGTGDCGARLMIGDKWAMPFWLNECGHWRRDVGVFD